MSVDFKVWESKYPHAWFSCQPAKNGFLPIDQPLQRLPEEFKFVNVILDKMKITQPDGSQGLLDKGLLYESINNCLPIYNVDEITDVKLLAALFRDYCFLASAYSLEPCHMFLKESTDNKYGEARSVLPPQLSIPLINLLILLLFLEKSMIYQYLDL